MNFHPFEAEARRMIFKNSVHTSKFTVAKINLLMLFKEIITVHAENRTKHTNTICIVTYYQSRWYVYLPLGLKGLALCITALLAAIAIST
jgi:hypothetical protein